MGVPIAIRPPLSRLVRARDHVAQMVAIDIVYLPIFERLDAEVESAEAAQVNDPVMTARLLAERRRAGAA